MVVDYQILLLPLAAHFMRSGKTPWFRDWLNKIDKGYEMLSFNALSRILLMPLCPELVLFGRLTIIFSISC